MQEGDLVAYRLLELSSSWTPELCSFRVLLFLNFSCFIVPNFIEIDFCLYLILLRIGWKNITLWCRIQQDHADTGSRISKFFWEEDRWGGFWTTRYIFLWRGWLFSGMWTGIIYSSFDLAFLCFSVSSVCCFTT